MKKALHAFILFSFLTLSWACTPDDTMAVVPATEEEIAEAAGANSYFFTAVVNGVSYSIFADNETIAGTASHNSGGLGGLCYTEQSMVLTNAFTPGVNQIHVTLAEYDVPCEVLTCDSMIQLFDQPEYLQWGNPFTQTDGVQISFWDESGELYTSYNGDVVENSYFRITEYIDSSSSFDQTLGIKKIATAEFRCALYSESGAAVSIFDGRMRSKAVVCQP